MIFLEKIRFYSVYDLFAFRVNASKIFIAKSILSINCDSIVSGDSSWILIVC